MEGQDGKKRFSEEDIKDVIKRYTKARSSRSVWESNWQELAEYIIPERANITTSSMPGQKKTSKIVDTTALDALELWASGLNGLMTNEALDWFSLKLANDNLNDDQDVAIWLEDTANRMHAAIRESNFQMEIYECYLDAGSLGTTSIYITEGVTTALQFQARHINEICIAENSDGFVDTIFREFELTARQIKQQFGEDSLTPSMKSISKDDEDKLFKLFHHVYPRSDDQREKDDNGDFKENAKSMPFASVYIALDEKKVLAEGGYPEFPYAVPRTKKMTGEIYGRSPSWNALPDIKMVNAMCKTYLRTIQKMADPPVALSDEGWLLPIRLSAGGINLYSDAGGQATGREIKTIGTGSQPQFADKEIESRRQSIKQKFFYDLWMLPEQPNMTATEVLERIQQKLRIIGPFLGRFQYELLKPIVLRVFGIMYRAGKLLEIPEVLARIPGSVKIVFTSPISDAQQAYQAEALNKTMMMASPMLQVAPESIDNIDSDAIVRFYWDTMRAPMSLLRKEADVDKIREDRQKAAKEQKQQVEMMAMTEGAKNLKGTGIMDGIVQGVADQTGTTQGMLQ